MGHTLTMRYHTTGRLSENILETPEGYLLCPGVPVARTGVMEYLPEEVGIESVPAREEIKIYRLEADVFDERAVASFEGKPLTINHPDEDVGPETWRELARGTAQNLRRGLGKESDLLLADLLITDAEAIAAVQEGLREISCGYDAEYEETAPGVGRQINIIGNHVALVDKGRCGPRCKIKDTETHMGKPLPRKMMDWKRILANPKVRKALDEAIAEAEEPAKKDPAPDAKAKDDDRIAALEAKVDEILLALRPAATDEDPENTGDEDPDATADEDPANDNDPEQTGDEDPEEKTKTGDAAMRRRTADADTVRRAKLLAPGLSVRVGDSRCAAVKQALRAAVRDKAIDTAVKAVLRGSTLDSADCLTLDAAFVTASELMKAANNRKTSDGLSGRRSVKDFGSTVTPADMNAANREFYARSK
jgi:hypothetical protein